MKIGPKFKIAKRLGAPIFEKTQSQKFELSVARSQNNRRGGRRGQISDYKRQLTEKQKMRYTYGLAERQLRRYVDEAMERSTQPVSVLMERLESRLDNVAYRLGLAKTRRLARQMVSHGHICVNGRKYTIPSHRVRIGDVISVREGSRDCGLFTDFADRHETASVPSWLKFDSKKLTGEVTARPVYDPTEFLFDPEQVLEYYSR
ncbi:MAG: 30S ribosomal protein S4 [Patescibacteria group bacterium]